MRRRERGGPTWRQTASLAVVTVVAWVGLLGATQPPANAAPPRRIYSIEDSPGYVPVVDPESAAVAAGHRLNAPLVSRRLRGGARSMDELGRAVCRALRHSRRDSLMSLCVRDDEFRDILWREFPQSRPATGLQWEDAWRVLVVRLDSGCSEAVRDYGGRTYEFLGFEADSVMAYRNFTMHSRLTLVARDDEGQVRQMRWLRAVVERKGSYKIYSTTD